MLNLRVVLGVRIEELRDSLKMTRRQLAELVNVEERTIIDYERHGTWPGPEKIVLMADALGVPVHELFNFTDSRKRNELSFEQRLEGRGFRSDRGKARLARATTMEPRTVEPDR